MANLILNIANCSTQGNTGGTFCNAEPGYLAYALPVPKGTVIPNTALVSQAAFTTFVQAALWANSRTTRWQKSPKLVEFKDGTKEPQTEDLDGYMVLTQMMPYVWTYRFANGFSGATKNLHQIWRADIHQMQNFYDFFFIDSNNMWWGTNALDSTGAQGMGAISLTQIIIPDWVQATPKSANKYNMMIVLADNGQLNANFASVQCSTLASAFLALTDVSVTVGVTATTSTNIYVSGKIGGNTLGKQYGAALAIAALWVITDITTGTKTFTTSGVTYDAVNDQYKIAGTWSTSNTGDSVTVALASPSVITAAPYNMPIVTEGTNVLTYTAP